MSLAGVGVYMGSGKIEQHRQVHFDEARLNGISVSNVDDDPGPGAANGGKTLQPKPAVIVLRTDVVDLDGVHVEYDAVVAVDGADFSKGIDEMLRVVIAEPEEIDILGGPERIGKPFGDEHRAL
jgi:hypothetical protein